MKWISVSEKLPELTIHENEPFIGEWDNSEPVLVYHSDDKWECKYLVAQYTNGFADVGEPILYGWVDVNDGEEVKGVLAWMPLPQPYTAERKTESNSEIPNNCEHITEDGVTCAKYPACDDCLDNPLNKVKGSERLLKGKTEPTISKMEQVDEPKTQMKTQNSNLTFEKADEPQTASLTSAHISGDIYHKWEKPPKFEHKEFTTTCVSVPACLLEIEDEPQTDCYMCKWLGDVDVCGRCRNRNLFAKADTKPKPKDEPQTDCPWK